MAIYIFMCKHKNNVMLANMFYNIKYLNSVYTKEQMDLCASNCPNILLREIPNYYIDMLK